MKKIVLMIVVAFIITGCHGSNKTVQAKKIGKDSKSTVQEIKDKEADPLETGENVQSNTHTEDVSKENVSQGSNESNNVQETKDNNHAKLQSRAQKSSIQNNSTSQSSRNEVSDKSSKTSNTETVISNINEAVNNNSSENEEEAIPVKKIPIYQTTYWAMCNDKECPNCGYKVTSTVSQEDAINKLNSAGHGNNPICSSYRYGFHEELIGYR